MGAKRALAMSAKDNIAVALEPIEAGDEVNVHVKGDIDKSVEAAETIPYGFKIALTDLKKGSSIIRYGEIMGLAMTDIKAGAQVHIHNVEGVRVQG